MTAHPPGTVGLVGFSVEKSPVVRRPDGGRVEDRPRDEVGQDLAGLEDFEMDRVAVRAVVIFFPRVEPGVGRDRATTEGVGLDPFGLLVEIENDDLGPGSGGLEE